MRDIGTAIFLVLSLASLSCFVLADRSRGGLWSKLAVGFAAIAGLSLCSAVTPGHVALTLAGTVAAALSMAFLVWWFRFLKDRGHR